jgi:hypothetical protein
VCLHTLTCLIRGKATVRIGASAEQSWRQLRCFDGAEVDDGHGVSLLDMQAELGPHIGGGWAPGLTVGRAQEPEERRLLRLEDCPLVLRDGANRIDEETVTLGCDSNASCLRSVGRGLGRTLRPEGRFICEVRI